MPQFMFLKQFFLCLAISCIFSISHADSAPISLFPLQHYDQNISHWLMPSDANYNLSLLNKETQQTQFKTFYSHYFGSFSPWNAEYINKILHKSSPNDVTSIEKNIITDFSNQHKSDTQIGYGANFRPYSQDWINAIAANINTNQFYHLSYHSHDRGIAIDNLYARVLPTDEPHFYSYKLAGQGYPFDNLQMSSLWAGTPVYILGETRDHAWYLVLTPDYIAWVKSQGIAHVNEAFVTRWLSKAKIQLAAITHNQTSIVDSKGNFHYLAYTGAVFPVTKSWKNSIKIMTPVIDENY